MKKEVLRFFLLCALAFMGAPALADTATVVDNVRANLRSGKGENYRVVTSLPSGSQVEVLEVSNDYARVQTPEGKSGWVAVRLLRMNEGITASAPLPDTPTKPASKEEMQLKLEALEHQLEEERRYRDEAQAEVDRLRGGESGDARMRLLWVGLGAFVVGILLGMFLRERHYQKRLHGLRV